jgi:hypothetical protein
MFALNQLVHFAIDHTDKMNPHVPNCFDYEHMLLM